MQILIDNYISGPSQYTATLKINNDDDKKKTVSAQGLEALAVFIKGCNGRRKLSPK